MASGQVLGLASGPVRGGRREEDGDDVVAPRDPGHLDQIVAEVFERNPMGRLHPVAVAKCHARLEHELEQSGLPSAGRVAERIVPISASSTPKPIQ